jgi:hypothetical protein
MQACDYDGAGAALQVSASPRLCDYCNPISAQHIYNGTLTPPTIKTSSPANLIEFDQVCSGFI